MFYNKYFANNYEELITYYPKFYRDVLEMRAILETQGKLADDLEDNIERVFDNCFIDTADETTISRLEKFLGIGLHKQRTLEERRRLVKSYFIGNGKLSAAMIAEMVSAYTGAAVESKFEPFDTAGNNKLYIFADRGTETTLYIGDIISLLQVKLPAHISHDILIRYENSTVVSHEIEYGYPAIRFCGTIDAGQEDTL